jgi:DNA modification methylase
MATSKTARHAIEYRLIASLAPDPENAREHSRAQVKQIARSIEAFGFNVPILVDAELKVVAGHGRLEALKLLGHVEAPVVRLEHLTPAQAKAFAIADNRATDTSSFNDRQLALNLKALAEIDLDFDIEATGFSIGEIDLKIEGLGDLEPDRSDPDDELPPSGPRVCGLGDLWILGEHRILCADALNEADYHTLLGDELVAAAFCDPPYNVAIDGHVSGKGKRKHREFASAVGEMDGPEFTTFLSAACRLAAHYSQDGAVQFWCMDWRHIRHLLAAGAMAFDELLNLCVWVKTNGAMGSLYRSQHELIAVFRKGHVRHRNNVQLGRYGRNRTNVWSYPGANSFLRAGEDADLMAQHPTPKPVQMVADALLDVTARRDLVLDSFLGSGSTLLACERIGRRCRGIELDPLYVDLAIRRWQRLTGEGAVLEATGETFDGLCAKAEAA